MYVIILFLWFVTVTIHLFPVRIITFFADLIQRILHTQKQGGCHVVIKKHDGRNGHKYSYFAKLS